MPDDIKPSRSLKPGPSLLESSMQQGDVRAQKEVSKKDWEDLGSGTCFILLHLCDPQPNWIGTPTVLAVAPCQNCPSQTSQHASQSFDGGCLFSSLTLPFVMSTLTQLFFNQYKAIKAIKVHCKRPWGPPALKALRLGSSLKNRSRYQGRQLDTEQCWNWHQLDIIPNSQTPFLISLLCLH